MMRIDDVLGSARWFPHRYDPASDRLLYVQVDPAAIERIPFLDGRTPLGSGGEAVVEMRDALDWATGRAQAPPALLFHTAFCGSTLLADLLSVPGHVRALKEPQVLVDLAGLRRGPSLTERLRFVLGQLGRAEDGLAVLVKPSNWANTILPEMLETGAPALLLTSEMRNFLIAVLRGGRERIAFVSRFAAHLVKSRPELVAAMAEAAAGEDALAKTLRFAALAHRGQRLLFAEGRAIRPDLATPLEFARLRGEPIATVQEAAMRLGLSLPADAIETRVRSHGQHHSKGGGGTFDAGAEAAAGGVVLARHGELIEDAERWADRLELPPPA